MFQTTSKLHEATVGTSRDISCDTEWYRELKMLLSERSFYAILSTVLQFVPRIPWIFRKSGTGGASSGINWWQKLARGASMSVGSIWEVETLQRSGRAKSRLAIDFFYKTLVVCLPYTSSDPVLPNCTYDEDAQNPLYTWRERKCVPENHYAAAPTVVLLSSVLYIGAIYTLERALAPHRNGTSYSVKTNN